MSRKRKGEFVLLEALLPAVGLCVFLLYFSGRMPGAREAVLKAMSPVFWFIGILVAVYVSYLGFCFYRRAASNPERDQALRALEITRQRRAQIGMKTTESAPPIMTSDFDPEHSSAETRIGLTRQPSPQRAHPEASLHDQLRAIDWYQFEKVVALLYEARGHRVTRRGGANPDGGVDLLAEKDGQRTAIQCKHWQSWAVKPDKVRELIGARTIERADACALVTLQGLTAAAEELARQQSVELVDASHLADWLKELRFTPLWPKIQNALDSQDKHCPRCEAPLVQRVAGRGENAGGTFWGCSAYPRCKFTLEI